MLLLFFHLKMENLEADHLVCKLQLHTYLVNWMSHISSLQKNDSPWMTVSGLGEMKVLFVVPGLGVGAVLVTWSHPTFSQKTLVQALGWKSSQSYNYVYGDNFYLRVTQWREISIFRLLFIYFKHTLLYEKTCALNSTAYTNLISQPWREPRVTSSHINEWNGYVYTQPNKSHSQSLPWS